jgi:hypothetical protein
MAVLRGDAARRVLAGIRFDQRHGATRRTGFRIEIPRVVETGLHTTPALSPLVGAPAASRRPGRVPLSPMRRSQG